MVINQINRMDNFKASYDKILNILNSLFEENNFFARIRTPKLTDKEIIAINLTAEYLSIDSEHQLFRRINKDQFPNLVDRSVYNRRKRTLAPFIEKIRLKMAACFNEFEDYFIVDSMPLEVCKLSRSNRAKICKEDFHTAPDKGFCASQQMHFYGYKIHATCSVQGVFQTFDITKASVHDIHYLKDIQHQLNNCNLLGDKGYLSAEIQLDLFETTNIKLKTPMRANQKGFQPQPYVYRKVRKRIETCFSQLCDQFLIRRNYAKTFDGFRTRIISKITSITVIQLINKLMGRNINNIKVAIA